MNEYIKCRACGFIMEKGNAPEVCPACGVGNRAFEDYKYNLSERRRLIMAIDIHPVILHVPQAVSGMIPFFALLSCFVPETAAVKLLAAVEVLVYILPLSVMASFMTGIFDGYNRFKKTGTPALKKKMSLAVILFVITCVMFYLVLTKGTGGMVIHLSVLSMLALAVEVTLSRIGIKLMYAYMPG